ncbi:polymer-forming cytoskeletal protein [Providencia rettgeri]
MFGKKTPQNLQSDIIHPQSEDENLMKKEKLKIKEVPGDQKNTIISHDVTFEGNIKSNQSIYVYGKVIGDIIAEKNTVNVMLNGEVKGNITSHTLITNGKIYGECRSEYVKIEDNGNVEGSLNYTSIEIKKGGIIIGSSQLLSHKKNNVALDAQKKMDELMLVKKNDSSISKP